MNESRAVKPLLWVGSSKRDLIEMPKDVMADFGHGLYQAQLGEYPDIAKTLSGFGSANVIELVLDYKTDTFRAVYTVKFSDAVVVIHVYQKKSKKGKETPKQDKELIHSRLKLAESIYKEWKNSRGKKQ